MTDIVEWLRIEARRDPEIQHAGHSRLSDAADEIEKLRGTLRVIAENPGWLDHHCRAQAAIDRSLALSSPKGDPAA